MSGNSDEPQSQREIATVPARWQFRLWHLFALTTYVAVVTGIATWLGPQSLMLTFAWGVALVNFSGGMACLQTRKVQSWMLGAAWLTFLVSLLLPCTTGSFTVFGCQAAWVFLTVLFESLGDPDSDRFGNIVWTIAIDVANVLQAVLPLIIWRLRTALGKCLAAVLCATSTSVFFTLIFEPYLFVAYYFWCASFLLVLAAVPIGRKTLTAMGVMTLILSLVLCFAGDVF